MDNENENVSQGENTGVAVATARDTMDREGAIAAVKEHCEAWNYAGTDIDEVLSDDFDPEDDFDAQVRHGLKLIVKWFMEGRLTVVHEEGMRAKLRHQLTQALPGNIEHIDYREVTAGQMKIVDRHKKNENVGKTITMLGVYTGIVPRQLNEISQIDFNIYTTITGFFFGL